MQRITDDDKLEAAISKKRDDLLRQADQGDLISFGIVPELVGRFPVIVPFHSLDKVILLCLFLCFFFFFEIQFFESYLLYASLSL